MATATLPAVVGAAEPEAFLAHVLQEVREREERRKSSPKLDESGRQRQISGAHRGRSGSPGRRKRRKPPSGSSSSSSSSSSSRNQRRRKSRSWGRKSRSRKRSRSRKKRSPSRRRASRSRSRRGRRSRSPSRKRRIKEKSHGGARSKSHHRGRSRRRSKSRRRHDVGRRGDRKETQARDARPAHPGDWKSETDAPSFSEKHGSTLEQRPGLQPEKLAPVQVGDSIPGQPWVPTGMPPPGSWPSSLPVTSGIAPSPSLLGGAVTTLPVMERVAALPSVMGEVVASPMAMKQAALQAFQQGYSPQAIAAVLTARAQGQPTGQLLPTPTAVGTCGHSGLAVMGGQRVVAAALCSTPPPPPPPPPPRPPPLPPPGPFVAKAPCAPALVEHSIRPSRVDSRAPSIGSGAISSSTAATRSSEAVLAGDGGTDLDALLTMDADALRRQSSTNDTSFKPLKADWADDAPDNEGGPKETVTGDAPNSRKVRMEQLAGDFPQSEGGRENTLAVMAPKPKAGASLHGSRPVGELEGAPSNSWSEHCQDGEEVTPWWAEEKDAVGPAKRSPPRVIPPRQFPPLGQVIVPGAANKGWDPWGEAPDKLCGDCWEEPREAVGLKLVLDLAPPCSAWHYPLKDDSRRSFVGYLQSPFSQERCHDYFDRIRAGTDWRQPDSKWGKMPRMTSWMVKRGCSCTYKYGLFEVPAQEFPPWMIDLMSEVMPHCGLMTPAAWPDSCNLNLYEDGGMSVGWHADDEKLFQGKFRDVMIISLSLGVKRKFELRLNWPEEGEQLVRCILLGSGDIMTMEGMVQKHFQHRVPREDGVEGPRINLTWRWVLKHNAQCPAERHRSDDGLV